MGDDLEARLRELLPKVTPGPWEARPKEYAHRLTVYSPAGDAEIGTWFVAEVQWGPNASFIAAAPELAAAYLAQCDEARAKDATIHALDDALFSSRQFHFEANGLAARNRLRAEKAEAERDALKAALERLLRVADDTAWSANIGTMDDTIEAARAALNGGAK